MRVMGREVLFSSEDLLSLKEDFGVDVVGDCIFRHRCRKNEFRHLLLTRFGWLLPCPHARRPQLQLPPTLRHAAGIIAAHIDPGLA